MKRIALIIVLGIAWIAMGMVGCAGVSSTGAPPPSEAGGGKSVKPLSPAPVITQSFASPRIRPGETWKVYLVASDPENKIKNIVCTIDQPGIGVYPISVTKVSPGVSQLNGYTYLATSAFAPLDFTSLTLTVRVQDAAGQYSNPVKFALSFNDRYTQEPPSPGIFKDHDLGPIMIRLRGLRKNPLDRFP